LIASCQIAPIRNAHCERFVNVLLELQKVGGLTLFDVHDGDPRWLSGRWAIRLPRNITGWRTWALQEKGIASAPSGQCFRAF
jgi:hypothetical protein